MDSAMLLHELDGRPDTARALLRELRESFATVEAEVAAGPILPRVTAEEIRGYLASRYQFDRPMALDEVVVDVQQMLRVWQVQVTHPRYFGLSNPSVTLASVVADTLVAMYNPQLANWRTSPAGNEIERHTLRWFADRFGLPGQAVGSFTGGGSEANLSAVVVALTHAFPEYGEHGLRSLDAAPAIYLTEEAHQSFNKVAHMTGIGRRSLRVVATGPDLKMDPEDLRTKVERDKRSGLAPFMVVASGGTTAAGVIDPLREIGSYCREAGLWFHVDAAWGGGAIVSPRLRTHLAGIESADSITCDAHKWLSVPMGSGMFFCRHPESVAAAFRADLSYMPGKQAGPVTDPYTTTVQWSRRLIGLKIFMALAERGEAGYAEMLEHQARMGELLRDELKASGWQVLNATPFPLVCFTREGLIPAQFLAALHQRQIAWMSEAKISGEPVVRACVTSFHTSPDDIRWVVGEMNALIHSAHLAKP